MSAQARAVSIFLLLAFTGAWSVWAIAWLAGAFNTSATGQIVVAVGAFSPALAAVIVRRWVAREGFADAGLRPKLRHAWPYYAAAWLLPLPILGVIVALAAVLGLPFAHRELPVSGLLTALIAGLLVTPLFLGEELGWRGYLQIRVFRGRPLLAACFTGVVWGVFHFPVVLAGFEAYENVVIGLVTFTVFTVLLSLILGWLRTRSGSLWPACLGHSAANFVGGSLSGYLFVGSGSFMLTSFAGVLAWVPLGAICAWIVLTGRLVGVDDGVPEAAEENPTLDLSIANG